LKVPAEFKRVIDEKYGQQFYITSSMEGCSSVSLREWERIEQKLQGSRISSHEEEISGQNELLRPAGGNRWAGTVVAAQLLRESGQIKGEVAVLGNLTYLVVRNLELFKREIEEEKFTPEDEKTLDETGHLVGEGSTDTPQGLGMADEGGHVRFF